MELPGDDREPGLVQFWSYVAERGRWYRQHGTRRVRVLGRQDTSPSLLAEEPDDNQLCECCLSGQRHSRAYHFHHRHAGAVLLTLVFRKTGVPAL